MAGERGQRREPTLRFVQACRELADELGWRERDVFFQYQQLAWILEFERPYPRPVAEIVAYAYVKAIFDKRGEQPS